MRLFYGNQTISRVKKKWAIPIEVAFGVKPRQVEPCGRMKSIKLFVVSFNIRSTIVHNRP